MQIVVNLDPDVEELVRKEALTRNVSFDRALNDAVRAGLTPDATSERQRKPFVQKTYSMGSDGLEVTMALADQLEDEERIRKMRLAEKVADGP